MRAHLHRLAVAPFEVAAAFAATLLGIIGTLGRTPEGLVEEAVPTLARAWSIGYAAAGIAVIIGLAVGRRAVEVVGLTMIAAGVAIQVVAAIHVAGFTAGLWMMAARIGFAIAALIRTHTVVTGHDIVTVDVEVLRMITPELVVAVIVALFGGGTIVGLLRLRGENSRIVVDAAQGAVIVQSSVINDLREQIEALTQRMQHVEKQAEEAEERAKAAAARARKAEARAQSAEQHRDILLQANTDLQDRLDILEAEVRRLGGTLP